VAAGGRRVWVSVAGAGRALPATGSLAADARVDALPGPPCGGVITGRDGDPDYLIAADLPLGSQRESTLPMSEAIAFVLRQHNFRAGKFTLGLQTCNDAGTETGIADERRCRGNAKLYANNPAILGIVGALNSACSERMLPILNHAPGGPPALVSPANSDPELVRDEPARDLDVLGELYPTGQRGYARPWPSDDTETAAVVLLAKQHAAGGSVFYLEDREFTANTLTWTWFRRAARRAGLRIAGREAWRNRPNHRALAERVRASGARVVYVAGLPEVVPALRAVLDPDVTIIGAGLLPISILFADIGPAARGMLITSQGLTPDRLGSTGKQFVHDFGATQPGGHVATLDVYAAAATEILLDAIARSDGTRESVARALKDTHLPDSVIGPLTLDGNGEPTTQSITVLRADRGGSRKDITLGIEGSTVIDVITPPAELVGPADR
jgi:branched-chain amino acid transport system substrate-binding protein